VVQEWLAESKDFGILCEIRVQVLHKRQMEGTWRKFLGLESMLQFQ